MTRLAGKKIFITGASRGIGCAIDFDRYAVEPGVELLPDLFLDPPES